jgi:hypothetical protein
MKPEVEPDIEPESEQTVWGAFVEAVKESPRLYFAPLVAVFRAVRSAVRYLAMPKRPKGTVEKPCQAK